jgi:hypothetical protein
MTRILVSQVAVMFFSLTAISTDASWAQEPGSTQPPQGPSGREQVVNNPHGLRHHERTVEGTDPYNTTREHSITLPDGRTINQTQVRSWDGTNGTMERSFSGPNGQTQQWQRSWTPDEHAGGETLAHSYSTQPPAAAPTMAPAASPAVEKVSWWQKLNPFRKEGIHTERSAAAPARSQGFTVGTSAGNSTSHSSSRPGEHPSVPASQNIHRPSWAGAPPRSMSPQGQLPHANGISTASRPNPGRGPSR